MSVAHVIQLIINDATSASIQRRPDVKDDDMVEVAVELDISYDDDHGILMAIAELAFNIEPDAVTIAADGAAGEFKNDLDDLADDADNEAKIIHEKNTIIVDYVNNRDVLLMHANDLLMMASSKRIKSRHLKSYKAATKSSADSYDNDTVAEFLNRYVTFYNPPPIENFVLREGRTQGFIGYHASVGSMAQTVVTYLAEVPGAMRSKAVGDEKCPIITARTKFSMNLINAIPLIFRLHASLYALASGKFSLNDDDGFYAHRRLIDGASKSVRIKWVAAYKRMNQLQANVDVISSARNQDALLGAL